MTDPAPTARADPDRAGAPPLSVDPTGTAGPPSAGTPGRRDSAEGRARSFREREARRRSARRESLVVALAVVLVVVGTYAIVTARPYSSSSYSLPTPGPIIVVNFGTPSVGAFACGAGGTASVERIPIANSTRPITTGNVVVRVSEIWDGDFIGDPGAVANATPSNPCAGSPPDAKAIWYVVLAAPNGTNLLTYTVAQPWVPVSHGSSNIGIANGSTIVLVTHTSLAGTGRGFSLVGTQNGSLIRGIVPL